MTTFDLLKNLEHGLAKVLDLGQAAPTPAQAALAKQFSDDLAALMRAPEPGKPSNFWQSICEDLHRRVSTGDPRFFMRWPPITATMVHGAGTGTYQQWWALRRQPDWRTVWAPALRHPRHGHPLPFPPMPSTTAMALEHASHLAAWRRAFQESFLDTDCIVEFGGGFGSMCRLIHALGFRGTYIIFDLPPVLALQRYFLGSHGIAAHYDERAGVWLCPGLDAIQDRLGRDKPGRVSMISTWALSEMPLDVRARVAAFFGFPWAAKALLAYQPVFEGNDNRAYFHDLMAQTEQGWRWHETPVDATRTTPTPEDSLYLFGRHR